AEAQRGALQVDFEPVGERPTVLTDRAGDGRDGRRLPADGRLVEVLGGEVDDRAVLLHADGGDGGRDAAKQPDEVRIVDVQVDRRAAGSLHLRDAGGPVGPGDHAGEVGGEEPAVTARFHRLEGEGELGEERQDVGDHQ